MTDQVLTILGHATSQGLIFSLVVMAIYLTSRVISFDDLTVEGSFGVGGAVAAILSSGGTTAHALLGLSAAAVAGAVAGLATSLCHNRLGMNNLISGLVVTTGVFSLSLALAGSNVSVEPTKLGSLPDLGCIYFLALTSVWILLRSEIGYLLRALGSNPDMLTSLGKSVAHHKTLALTVANALSGLSGGLFVLFTGYFSPLANVGTMVIGLASLMIAEAFSKSFGVFLIGGAIVYQLIFAAVLELQMPPTWNNLIKATVVVVLVAARGMKNA